jgi:hypothetical protein
LVLEPRIAEAAGGIALLLLLRLLRKAGPVRTPAASAAKKASLRMFILPS